MTASLAEPGVQPALWTYNIDEDRFGQRPEDILRCTQSLQILRRYHACELIKLADKTDGIKARSWAKLVRCFSLAMQCSMRQLQSISIIACSWDQCTEARCNQVVKRQIVLCEAFWQRDDNNSRRQPREHQVCKITHKIHAGQAISAFLLLFVTLHLRKDWHVTEAKDTQ